MTLTTDLARLACIRRAVVSATRAPSVHNTQPWRFVMSPDGIELHADYDRRLRVLDPHGRQLLMSCGCALFNARVSIAAAGYAAKVERLPDPGRSDVLARIEIDDQLGEGDETIAELEPAIALRQTNRRPFTEEAVPGWVIDELIDAGLQEGAELASVESAQSRIAVARLTQLADAVENADPAYRAELRAWTSDDPVRSDGVPSYAVPHVTGEVGGVPIRDFDTRGTGELAAETRSTLGQAMLLLGSLEDNRLAWLRTGEALERVLLAVAARGYTSSPFTQLIEVSRTNVLLRQELQLTMHPHILLRIGRAEPTSPTRRRRLADVITELRS